MPSVLYHSVTSKEDLKSILRTGLKTDSNSHVYLSKKPIKREPFQYHLKVKVPDMDRLWDWRDIWGSGGIDKEYDPSNPYYIYEEDIPKKYISVVK